MIMNVAVWTRIYLDAKEQIIKYYNKKLKVVETLIKYNKKQ